MKRYLNMVVLAGLAALALSAVAASAAQAETERDPIWLVKGAAIPSGTELHLAEVLQTKTWLLKTANAAIVCSAIHVRNMFILDLFTNGVAEVGDDRAEILFLGCKAEVLKINCGEVTGTLAGQEKGTIGWFALKSHLVWVDGASSALSGALDLFELPAGGVSFKYQSLSCPVTETTVTGEVLAEPRIAGKASTKGQEALEGELNFPGSVKTYELCVLGTGTKCELHTTTLTATSKTSTGGTQTESGEEIGLLTGLVLLSDETFGWS